MEDGCLPLVAIAPQSLYDAAAAAQFPPAVNLLVLPPRMVVVSLQSPSRPPCFRHCPQSLTRPPNRLQQPDANLSWMVLRCSPRPQHEHLHQRDAKSVL